jgi:heme oxygenase
MPVARTASSWVLERLERETREHHADAEADLFRVLDDATPAMYHRLLATIDRFEYAVESELVRTQQLPFGFVAARIKTGRLAEDLLALGDDPVVAALFAIPLEPVRFRDAYDALAWMYVVERNTLHHLSLYRALVPRLRTTLRIAATYLTSHATDVHARWFELGAYLDEVVDSPDTAAAIVEVASEAFMRQHAWHLEASKRSSLLRWTMSRGAVGTSVHDRRR